MDKHRRGGVTSQRPTRLLQPNSTRHPLFAPPPPRTLHAFPPPPPPPIPSLPPPFLVCTSRLDLQLHPPWIPEASVPLALTDHHIHNIPNNPCPRVPLLPTSINLPLHIAHIAHPLIPTRPVAAPTMSLFRASKEVTVGRHSINLAECGNTLLTKTSHRCQVPTPKLAMRWQTPRW